MSRTFNINGRGGSQHDVDFPDLSLARCLCWALDRLNISDLQRDQERDDERIEEETFMSHGKPFNDHRADQVDAEEWSERSE